jgi:coenzyme F420-reducing hydrogenase delta subunit/Pyruvate/2-oxoacid:ferredoxin oxidoreductase delta subunit
MRTAGDNLERLYREARTAGVVFFKYDNITIEYSDEKQTFHICASDTADSLEIFTNIPVLGGEGTYSDTFSRLTKMLKLKHDKFFLFPCLTNRKGIYYVNSKTNSTCSELQAEINFVLSDIVKELNTFSVCGTERYAQVDPEKCAFCYTCYRACPHIAMAPDYENSVMKNLNASCTGCGICFSVCPANAITIEEKTAVEVRTSSSSLKVFCCENSGEIAFQKVAKMLGEQGMNVSISSVSCGGELSAETIMGALKDFEKVLVAVCMDDACRHFDGNKRAKRYVERVKEMLKASGMDENRVVYMQLSHAMHMVLSEYIEKMA